MVLLLSRAIKIIVSQKTKFWWFNFNIVSGFQLSIFEFDKNQPEFQKTKLKTLNANTLLYTAVLKFKMMDSKNSEWVEKTEAKIREAFDLFDKDKADAIIQVIISSICQIGVKFSSS